MDALHFLLYAYLQINEYCAASLIRLSNDYINSLLIFLAAIVFLKYVTVPLYKLLILNSRDESVHQPPGINSTGRFNTDNKLFILKKEVVH